ncbi:hypothetical protein DFH29DRAFT_937950 [Suillus ampliporus]|nr:hypothetical protein DFH29DRAFT_937950 [Suillus ampliporus]
MAHQHKIGLVIGFYVVSAVPIVYAVRLLKDYLSAASPVPLSLILNNIALLLVQPEAVRHSCCRYFLVLALGGINTSVCLASLVSDTYSMP